MATQRQLQPEVHASSSEEEEEYDGSSSEETEFEEDEGKKTSPPTVPKVKIPSSSKNSKPDTARNSSSDGSDSGSASGSDSEETILRGNVDLNANQVSGKSTEEESSKAKKKVRSKPNTLASEFLPKPSTAAKRLSENPSDRDGKDSKKAKKVVSDEKNGVAEEDTAKRTGDDSKKQLFQRLWSLDDEIAILKGIVEYFEKKGLDPVADMFDFHEFMKNKLHIDVTKSQLSDKVRRFKKKYVNNASKGKNGGDRTFSNDHEQKAFVLSKKIWGTEANCLGLDSQTKRKRSKKNRNQRPNKTEPSLKIEEPLLPCRQKEATKMEVSQNPTSLRFSRVIGDSNLEGVIIKDGLELIKGSQRIELEEKWKGLRVDEVELFLKRVELIHEQTKLVLEALKSSGN